GAAGQGAVLSDETRLTGKTRAGRAESRREIPMMMMNDIHPNAKIAPDVLELLQKKRSFVYIGEGTEIAENVRIANGVQIGKNCTIGKDSKFQAHVIISCNTLIGKRSFFTRLARTAVELYPTLEKKISKSVVVADDCVIREYGLLVGCRIGKGSVLAT